MTDVTIDNSRRTVYKQLFIIKLNKKIKSMIDGIGKVPKYINERLDKEYSALKGFTKGTCVKLDYSDSKTKETDGDDVRYRSEGIYIWDGNKVIDLLFDDDGPYSQYGTVPSNFLAIDQFPIDFFTYPRFRIHSAVNWVKFSMDDYKDLIENFDQEDGVSFTTFTRKGKTYTIGFFVDDKTPNESVRSWKPMIERGDPIPFNPDIRGEIELRGDPSLQLFFQT